MKLLKANLHWLVFCISAIVFFAIAVTRFEKAFNDFVPVYTGARCLLHGCNPYDTAQLEQQFYQAGGRAAELPSWDIDVPVYPPSTFLILAPLGMLPFSAARLLWFVLNACVFVTAAALIASLPAGTRQWPGTLLASAVLGTSSILLILGQPAIFAISLLLIGSYLFLRGRLLPLATVLLVFSLAVKPQIGGLIVVYLLLQRIHWRYAAGALAGAAAMLACGGLVLHQHPRSADWATTLRANLTATLSPGGSADPRPANQQSVGDINLQALTSVFLVDASAFNPAAYAIFLLLLAAWVIAVLRMQASGDMHLVALGGLAILSLMPVYHRFYDTRLLLLTIPAIVLVWEQRRLWGLWLGGLTVLTIVSVQYRVQAYLLQHSQFESVLQRKVLFLLLLRQQNLELVLLFCLYLLAMGTIRFTAPATPETLAANAPTVVAP